MTVKCLMPVHVQEPFEARGWYEVDQTIGGEVAALLLKHHAPYFEEEVTHAE